MAIPLNDTELDQLEAAVQAAEAGSDGELVTVIAEHSDDDDGTYDCLLIAAVAALILPALLVLFSEGSAGSIYAFQMMVFFAVFAILQFRPALRYRLIPQSTLQDRVRRHAIVHFHDNALHRAPNRLGVVIFVSLAERRVEILADCGFDNTVSATTWRNAVNALVSRVQRGELHQGLCETVRACSIAMAQAAPATQVSQNVLPDRLVIVSRS